MNQDKDPLGTRIKEQYEFRSRCFLPRRTYTIIRLDGKAFHTYTRGLERPYDAQFMLDMAITARFLCQNIDGAKFAYLQSDEISILLTDFTTTQTEAWFNGNTQKLTSVSASMATAKFNDLRRGKLACFDSRAFTIPDPVEVGNYFLWRQRDAVRNSVSMAAQQYFSNSKLLHKNSDQIQEMLWSEIGINYNDYPPNFKRGSVVWKEALAATDTEITKTWVIDDAPSFGGLGWLSSQIPDLPRF